MSDQHEEIESPGLEPLGSLLERTRRSRHLNLDEAAEATRISPRVLAALEADDFDRVQAEVFTRGFIKLYAEYLGLDPEEALEHYINQENADPNKPAERPYRREVLQGEAMAHPRTFFRGSRRTLLIILLLALLVGLYLLGRMYKPHDNMVGENLGGNYLSPSLAERQSSPSVPGIVPPANEQGQAIAPSGKGEKDSEPKKMIRKLPEPAAPTVSPPAATSPPEAKPATGQEARPETRPQSAPAKPQLLATAKPASAAKQAAETKPMAEAGSPPATAIIAKAAETEPTRTPASFTSQTKAASPKPETFRPVTVKVATTTVDGADDIASSSATAAEPDKYVLEGRFRDSSWVHVEVDGQPIREYTSQADVTRVWRAAKSLVLELGNGGAVDLTLNGKPFPVTTKPGEATIIRLPPVSP